jgi:hypothetical protein
MDVSVLLRDWFDNVAVTLHHNIFCHLRFGDTFNMLMTTVRPLCSQVEMVLTRYGYDDGRSVGKKPPVTLHSPVCFPPAPG